jgi:hypothetical protein
MGLFGAIIKTALSPLAVLADAGEIVTGGDPTHTADTVESIIEDFGDILE